MSEDSLDLTIRNLSLENLDTDQEEQLIATLAQRVAYLLDREPNLLFSTLYRLDVLEHKINQVLDSSEDNAYGLARLIVERQREKLKTRREWQSDWSFDDE